MNFNAKHLVFSIVITSKIETIPHKRSSLIEVFTTLEDALDTEGNKHVDRCNGFESC